MSAGNGRGDARRSPGPTTRSRDWPTPTSSACCCARYAPQPAAGGRHENRQEYDRVMAEQRRTAVLIDPNRIYSNR